jgi:hypothetical protein
MDDKKLETVDDNDDDSQRKVFVEEVKIMLNDPTSWIHKKGSCKKLMEGPDAPSDCTVGKKWNKWMCLECKSVMESKASCINGCAWPIWGWVCIEHDDM